MGIGTGWDAGGGAELVGAAGAALTEGGVDREGETARLVLLNGGADRGIRTILGPEPA